MPRFVGWNSSTSTPRLQSAMLRKPCSFELLHHRRRRHHDAAGLVVERVHVAIAGPKRDPLEARVDVFRKLGVVARRERKLVLQANRARVPAERAFGGDVDGVRREGEEAVLDIFARAERQADFRIGDQRHWCSGSRPARPPRSRSPWPSVRCMVLESVRTTPFTCGSQASVTSRILVRERRRLGRAVRAAPSARRLGFGAHGRRF